MIKLSILEAVSDPLVILVVGDPPMIPSPTTFSPTTFHQRIIDRPITPFTGGFDDSLLFYSSIVTLLEKTRYTLVL